MHINGKPIPRFARKEFGREYGPRVQIIPKLALMEKELRVLEQRVLDLKAKPRRTNDDRLVLLRAQKAVKDQQNAIAFERQQQGWNPNA